MKKIALALSAVIAPMSILFGQIITTIGGSGIPNNVPATAIGMQIFGTIADKYGNIYVSDASNGVVRKVDISTGIATIVAGIGNFGDAGDGGQATAASLNSPADVALDTAGNLYIGSLYGFRIRKVDLSTGIITTVVGTGVNGSGGDGGQATAAKIGNEPGMGFDNNNNLYISDFSNNKVRMVNATTGIITTIAGTGAAGYNGDNIAATAAELNYPAGVCVDDSGSVFIAEQTNCRIRKINWKTGIITTFAGTGSFAYGGDGGPATAAKVWAPLSVKFDKGDNNIYIADWGNNRVRRVNISTGIITTVAGDGIQGHSGDGGPATAAKLTNAYTVALDTNNNLFIVEGFIAATGSNRWIREVNATTQIISTVVGNGSPGNYTGDGIPATTAQLNNPSGLAVDATGNIYVADMGNDRVRQINTSGIINTYAGNGSPGYKEKLLADSGELYDPSNLAFDKSGNLFVADEYNDRIRKVNTNDSIFDFAGNGYDSPYGGAFFGDNGNAVFAELYFPAGVATDDSGSVYIADFYNNRIRKVNWKTKIITTVAGNGTAGFSGDGAAATAAELSYPMGVALDNGGNMYIADYDNSRIRKVTLSTGVITTYAGNGSFSYGGDGGKAINASLNFPSGVAVDGNNAVYISDSYNNRIRYVDPFSTTINTIAGNGVTGFSGDGGNATAAELNYPQNVTFDAAGNMYIADASNNRIRKVTGVVKLGIQGISAANPEIQVYPNPNNGSFNVALKNTTGNSQLEVYNMLGEKIYNSRLESSNTQINLGKNPPGIYLYRVLTETGEFISEGRLVIN